MYALCNSLRTKSYQKPRLGPFLRVNEARVVGESPRPGRTLWELTATIHLHSTPYSVYNIRTIVILEWDVLPWRLPNMPILRYEWRIRAAWNPIGRHC